MFLFLSKLIRKISTKVVFEEGKTEEAKGNFEDDEEVVNNEQNEELALPSSKKLQNLEKTLLQRMIIKALKKI